MNHQVEERSSEIDGFVARLVAMRADAGDPSFRSMAKRSGAISHTTLHDAVQGTRLPSWETVVEFARACKVTPDPLREHWLRADATVHASAPEPIPPPARPRDDAGAEGDAPASRRFGVGALAASAALGAVVAFTASTIQQGKTQDEARYVMPAAAATGTPTTAGCATNPGEWPKQPPRLAGDGALLVADISLPDCSEQPMGTTLTKTWRIKNNGALSWQGRQLRRIDPLMGSAACQTPEQVPIPDVGPGQDVDVSVEVATPPNETSCFVRWMIVDNDGHYAFPGQRPFFFSFFVR